MGWPLWRFYMSIDLNKQWPSLLSYYVGIPADGTSTYIENIYKLSKQNKAKLAAKLGLPDTLTVEEEVLVDLSERFAFSYKIACAVMPEDKKPTFDEFITNRTANQMKLSKRILSYAKTNSGVTTKILLSGLHSTTFRMKLSKELPKVPNAGAFVKNADLAEDALSIQDYDYYAAIIQNIYSEIASIKKATYGFSMDMFTMLSAGSSNSFSSCFTVGRFNSKGPLDIALSPLTGVIYNRQGNNVTGRAWVVFDKDFNKFVVMKSYGFIDDDIIKKVCSWLCALLDDKADWSYINGNNEDVYLSLDYKPAGWYLDPIRMFFFSSTSDKTRNIDVHGCVEAPCLLCGKHHTRSTLLCSECEETKLTTCKRCNKLMLKTDRNKMYPLCDNCIEKVTFCPVCGAQMKEGKTCPKCAWNNMCAVCGTKSDKPLKWIEGIPVCDSCISLLHKTTCECCGSHGLMYPYRGHALCNTCYQQLSSLPSASISEAQVHINPDVLERFVANNTDLNISWNVSEGDNNGH